MKYISRSGNYQYFMEASDIFKAHQASRELWGTGNSFSVSTIDDPRLLEAIQPYYTVVVNEDGTLTIPEGYKPYNRHEVKIALLKK